MRINSVKVQNFRCLLDVEIPFSGVTALVGRNGSGKSSILRAIHIFYTAGAPVGEEDYYNGDTESPIAIEITWDKLTAAEEHQYSPYIDGDTLSVRKEISWVAGKRVERYYGSRLQYEPFIQIRARLRAGDKISEFNQLVDSGKVPDLKEKTRSGAEADRLMKEWEQRHADLLTRLRDDGQFFGFRNVGVGKLERFTRFVYVQAVRDAAEDAVEGRGSPLSELMEMIVRKAIRKNPELEEFRRNVTKRYGELFSPASLPQLPELADRLTGTLQQYVTNAGVRLSWEDVGGLEIPLPKAIAELVEDGFPGPVSLKGHGLQRAFILTLLQFLASFGPEEETRGKESNDEETELGESIVPSVVLGIEEPEIYQHPSRQRRLASVFRELVDQSNSSESSTQVVFSTHSPYFVDVMHVDEVRLVKKVLNSGDMDAPMVSTVVYTARDQICEMLGRAAGMKITWERLKDRLLSVMNPLTNEGFFADVVVLVEGETDRAALMAAASFCDIDLDKYGTAIVPAYGKTNLDRPFCIFSSLGIPCYLVFDADKDKGEKGGKPETNQLLLKLANGTVEPFPRTQVADTFACFEENIEHQICVDFGGDVYKQLVEEMRDEFGYASSDDASKNPKVVEKVLLLAQERGCKCECLTEIVRRAVAMSPLSK